MTSNNQLILILIILMGLALSSCTTDTEITNITPSPQPTATATLEFSKQREMQAIWQRGSHSKVSFTAEFAQPSCAKCHSPQDWDPDDNPSEIAGCAEAIVNSQYGQKGVGDAQSFNSLNWNGVECKTCHLFDENGDPIKEIIFWNQETGTAEEVSNSTDLCAKCHTKTNDVDNSVNLGENNFHSSLSCITCHDPHKTTASCTDSGCHADVAKDLEIIKYLAVDSGHETESPHSCGAGSQCHALATQVVEEGQLLHIGVQHAFLTCSACHDGAGMEVGPVNDSSIWTTLQIVEWNGLTVKRPKFSHIITKKVDCTRCHYEDNPWELEDGVSTPVR